MVDRSLAGGLTNEGTFTPDQLYAGEADIVTTQEVVAAAEGALAQYQVVSLVGGKLRAYDKENGVAGTNVPYGVLPHAIPDAGVDQDTPVIIGGVLNFDVLVADGQTYAGLKAAFAEHNSNIVIQKLF
jgi:hypothetical protein